MEYSRGSEVKTEIVDTARSPPPRPRDDGLRLQGAKGSSSVQQSLLSCLLRVDSEAFTALLRTMECVLYNNNLPTKAEKNKAGEKLSALF